MIARPLPREQRWFVAIFFALVALPFFGVFPYIGVVMNPNENTRTYMTIAAVEHRTFQLDPVVARFGWINDMASVRNKQGVSHYYSVKGPLNSFAGVPVYWLQCKLAKWRGHPPPQVTDSGDRRNEWFERTTWVLRLFTVQLPCFLFLLWFERYLRGFSRDASLRLMAVAAAGLGTNYLGYAHMFASHALFAVAAFVGFGQAERELREQPDPRARSLLAAFASGMGIAAATGLEYHGFFLSAVLAVFGLCVFWRPTRLLAYGAGAMIPMGLVAFYQWKAFGSPLTPGHKFVENPLWAAEHARGLYGVILPSWKAIGSLSFDPGYGFFGMSPFMALGLPAIGLFLASPEGDDRARRVQRASTLAWGFAMIALWVAMCGAMEWRAGWTLGARRAGAAPPFFALGALMLLERAAARWPRSRNALRGVALGTTLVGVASLGLTGIVYNTLPEEIARPFTQFALPLARVGVVPHHNAELLGFKGTTFWYLVAGALFLAPLLALFAGRARAEDDRDPSPRVGWGMLLAIPLLLLTGFPAYHVPRSAPATTLDYWTTYWQPPNRDRIATLVKQAPTTPCAWHWIADAQEILRMPALARQNRPAARAPQAQCRRWFLRRWFP
jgi:hypothetical protein